VSCTSENKQLERDFWAYTHTDENSDRVGEFAIGTNLGIERVIATSSRTRNFPASILPSATLTANIPARRGNRRPTSTSLGCASTSG